MKFIHPQAFGQDWGEEGRATIEQNKECECECLKFRDVTFWFRQRITIHAKLHYPAESVCRDCDCSYALAPRDLSYSVPHNERFGKY